MGKCSPKRGGKEENKNVGKIMFSKPGERHKLTDSIISISSNQRKYRENLAYIAKVPKTKDKEKFLKPAGENYFTVFKEIAVDLSTANLETKT